MTRGDNCMIIAKHGHHHKISMPIYCFHSSGGEVTYLDRGSVAEGACLLAGRAGCSNHCVFGLGRG